MHYVTHLHSGFKKNGFNGVLFKFICIIFYIPVQDCALKLQGNDLLENQTCLTILGMMSYS